MTTSDEFLAFSRFGLGARPGDLAKLTDPRAALLTEIDDPGMALINGPNLLDSASAYARIREAQKQRREARKVAASDPKPSSMADDAAPMSPGKPGPAAQAGLMQDEIRARLRRVKQADIGFTERLVAFWANHFAVEAGANQIVRGLAGAFEREAIRPHVLGRFVDLAMAATQHPAMLVYLNNAVSVGPDSRQGERRAKGLNENHAREFMELHTLGVDGGYDQADVTSFAKVLTGWTIGTQPNQVKVYGRFVFRPQAHEPGPQTVVGKQYDQPGVNQGRAVIDDLAASPATAHHIATKLARHFIADVPPDDLVDAVSKVFLDTGGDLHAVTSALVQSDSAWSMPLTKIRSPQEFLWASIRALDLDLKPKFVQRTLDDLGQSLWDPPSPQGFKDDVATWLAPDAMTNRLDFAELVATQANGDDDPRRIAADILGPDLSPNTRTAIERAESRAQALALMLMSPEFQRR